jgi:hypothetical protein
MSNHTPVVVRRTKPADNARGNPLAPSVCPGCTNAECNSAQEDGDTSQAVDQDGVNETDEEEAEAFPALRILTNGLIAIVVAVVLACVFWWAFRTFVH